MIFIYIIVFIYILFTFISDVDTRMVVTRNDMRGSAHHDRQSHWEYDVIVERLSDRHVTASIKRGDMIISMGSQSKRNGDTLREKHQK